MNIRRHFAALALAATFAATASLAGATTMIPVNLEHLVKYADRAFVCTVDNVEIIDVDGLKGERVTVTVSRAVLGEVEDGGTVTWIQYRPNEIAPLPSMPQYEIGGEYLIFLAGYAEGSSFTAPVALNQGAFTIVTNEETGAEQPVNAYNNQYLYAGMNVTQYDSGARRADESGVDRLVRIAQAVRAKQEQDAAARRAEQPAPVIDPAAPYKAVLIAE